MGYVSAAPSLSDRSRFKSYYRTYPSDAIFVPAVVSFISYYNWKKLLIITENANTFITVSIAFICNYYLHALLRRNVQETSCASEQALVDQVYT